MFMNGLPSAQRIWGVGMDTATKVLVVICFILIGALGFISGMFLKSSHGGDQYYNVTITGDTEGGGSSGPSWHRVMTFTGSESDYRYVNIRGNRLRVVFSATPLVNYDVNSITVDVLRDGYTVATDTVDWGATESPARKKRTVEVEGSPGEYCIAVYASEIRDWKVTVWDYY